MAEPKSTYKRPTTSSEDNPPRKRRKTMNSSAAANSSAMASGSTEVVHLQSVPAQFVDISDEQKSHTLRYMLHKFAADPSIVSARALVTLACEHGLKRQKRPLLLSALESHLCTWACLVHSADAQEAGQLELPNTDVLRPVDRHLASHAHVPAERHKLSRKRASHRHIVSLEAERDESAIHWLQVESEESLNEIMREDRAKTTAAILAHSPCSFCNRNELVSELKTWDTSDLDISLLEKTVDSLRIHYNLPHILSHSLHNDRYQACTTCARYVKARRFFKIPLYSWANGCWICPIPAALYGLSYAEELVIARAHTTKCWAKINSGSGPPILYQRAASGNVCIHPHEISTIATVLPCPMSALYDEIVVIFVTDEHEATAEMFKRTPFLVRRGRILHVLNWLKANNRLYSDIIIDLVALAEYLADEDGCVPFPMQFQSPNDTIRGQNSTYTGHGIDTMEAIFAEHSDQDSQIPLSLSGKCCCHIAPHFSNILRHFRC
ncbi:hypothetical protein B0H10DRAFT_1931636 [Mycena sp. CBHHK59/15]|nr:hypothetical protein B0H10DRAFT_1931636 [Mycena sp. CBHHK59/15]